MPQFNDHIEELEAQAHRLEDDMKSEFFKLKSASRKAITISLFAGAGALTAVALTKLLSKEKKPDKVVVEKKSGPEPKAKKLAFTSRIGTAVMALAVEAGRKKMVDFLNKKFHDNKPA